MSAILKAIIEKLHEEVRVTDVGVYVHATVVVSQKMGLAYTFPKRSLEGTRDRHEVVANNGRLTDFSARDLARYALSNHLMEASVGVAAINSLLCPPRHRLVEKNGVDLLLEMAGGKRLAVVGHFPFVERVRSLVKSLWILELDPQEGDLPAADAPKIIPSADVVAITGTTFINHTLEGLLEVAKGKRVVLLGPSTILSPVVFDFGISALCGVQVEDPALVIRHLKEGGSFRNLPGIKYITLLPK